jgi:hypothetical protein
MTRFIIRSGCENECWTVWDRRARGPARLFGKKLTRLSRREADAALARLERSNLEPPTLDVETWQVSYKQHVVQCRDETDAKHIARDLVKRGYQVAAQSTDPNGQVCSIGRGEIWAWLTE